jgi:hypothetical protein
MHIYVAELSQYLIIFPASFTFSYNARQLIVMVCIGDKCFRVLSLYRLRMKNNQNYLTALLNVLNIAPYCNKTVFFSQCMLAWDYFSPICTLYMFI